MVVLVIVLVTMLGIFLVGWKMAKRYTFVKTGKRTSAKIINIKESPSSDYPTEYIATLEFFFQDQVGNMDYKITRELWLGSNIASRKVGHYIDIIYNPKDSLKFIVVDGDLLAGYVFTIALIILASFIAILYAA